MSQPWSRGGRPSGGPGRLQDRVAVVTGAARGIGRAVALRFAGEAARAVVTVDVRHEEGRETARMVDEIGRRTGSRGLFVAADVSRPEQVEALARRVRAEFGRCDVLVNNAGISGRPIGDGPVHRCSLEAWERVLAVNLTGVFLCSKHVVPLMMEAAGPWSTFPPTRRWWARRRRRTPTPTRPARAAWWP